MSIATHYEHELMDGLTATIAKLGDLDGFTLFTLNIWTLDIDLDAEVSISTRRYWYDLPVPIKRLRA